MAQSSTSYKKGDKPPPNRRGRGKGKKSLMLEAIRSTCGSEEDFLKKVVQIGMGDLSNGIEPNPTLLNMVLQRIEPPLKANNECVNFDFDASLQPHEQAIQVLDAASKGIIPPDIASMFVSSIQAMLKIQEVTDFENRLKALESSQDD